MGAASIDVHQEIEEWRTIPPFPAYAASSFGRVKRVSETLGGNGSKRPGGNILTPTPLPTGHLRVTLSVGGRRHDALVHRLVAFAFLPPPEVGCGFVCHRDDNPGRNRPANLYWGTRRDNYDDAMANGRTAKGERVAGAKLTADLVLEMRQRAAAGANQHDLARDYRVAQSNVSLIVAGKTWRHVQ